MSTVGKLSTALDLDGMDAAGGRRWRTRIGQVGEHELTPDGLILRRNARTAGLSDHSLQAATRHGTLERVYWGMYLPSGSAGELLTREQRQHRYRYKVLGAVDAGRGDKAVSHWSAAALWGMPMLGGDLERVHFTANRTGGGRDRTRACTLHATPWQPDEVIELPGLLVTTPARTAVDISRAGTFEQGVCACDAALRMGATRLELETIVARAGRRKGIDTARRAVAFADVAAESIGESWSRALMSTMGDIPVPELQPEIHDSDGVFAARTDFRIRGTLLGEFDGYDKYIRYLKPGESPADAVYREKRREERLNELGFTVARWGWDDLMNPDRLRRILRNGLRRAGYA